jgi:hypothetical protein
LGPEGITDLTIREDLKKHQKEEKIYNNNIYDCSEKMPKRKDSQNSTKVQSFGMFAGAKVIRGPDWDWGNQDGKYGKYHSMSLLAQCIIGWISSPFHNTPRTM